MPLYSYRCAAGHEQEWLGRFEARPPALPCGCGVVAALVVSLPGRGVVRGGPAGGKGEPQRSHAGFTEESPGVWTKGAVREIKVTPYLCGGCGHKGWGDDVVPAACETCGSTDVRERAVDWHRSWWDAEGFNATGGYFDRGAGLWFSTRAERDTWAKENGMVESAGVNDDTGRAVRKESERQRELCEFWRGELRERDADTEYRRLVELGKAPDDAWLREEVGYKG